MIYIFKNKDIRKNKGFTLIELLVVIAIISLLSSIVFASLSTARGRSRDAKRMQDINQINIAINLYQNDHDGLPPDLGNPSCADISKYDPSCFASSGQGLENWNILAEELKPYLSSLPDDPCPSCTADASLILKAYAADGDFGFEYVYQAPAAVNAYLIDHGIDPTQANISGQPFSIYASRLEQASGAFGFGLSLPTVNVCPYNIEACNMWTQCNDGNQDMCKELSSLLEKCNAGNTEACNKLGVSPPKCPYDGNQEACRNWTQCQEGNTEICSWFAKCNAGNTEACNKLGVSPPK